MGPVSKPSWYSRHPAPGRPITGFQLTPQAEDEQAPPGVAIVQHRERVFGGGISVLLCRVIPHKWNNCRCARCGSLRDEGHTWDGCTCTTCASSIDFGHKWASGVCQKCGRECGHRHIRNCRCVECYAVAHENLTLNDDLCICRDCGRNACRPRADGICRRCHRRVSMPAVAGEATTVTAPYGCRWCAVPLEFSGRGSRFEATHQCSAVGRLFVVEVEKLEYVVMKFIDPGRGHDCDFELSDCPSCGSTLSMCYQPLTQDGTCKRCGKYRSYRAEW